MEVLSLMRMLELFMGNLDSPSNFKIKLITFNLYLFSNFLLKNDMT